MNKPLFWIGIVGIAILSISVTIYPDNFYCSYKCSSKDSSLLGGTFLYFLPFFLLVLAGIVSYFKHPNALIVSRLMNIAAILIVISYLLVNLVITVWINF